MDLKSADMEPTNTSSAGHAAKPRATHQVGASEPKAMLLIQTNNIPAKDAACVGDGG